MFFLALCFQLSIYSNAVLFDQIDILWTLNSSKVTTAFMFAVTSHWHPARKKKHEPLISRWALLGTRHCVRFSRIKNNSILRNTRDRSHNMACELTYGKYNSGILYHWIRIKETSTNGLYLKSAKVCKLSLRYEEAYEYMHSFNRLIHTYIGRYILPWGEVYIWNQVNFKCASSGIILRQIAIKIYEDLWVRSRY